MMTSGRFCETCGQPLGGDSFCTSCGTPARPVAVARPCVACGYALEPGAEYCINCGTVIASSPHPAPASLEPQPAGVSGNGLRLVLVAVTVAAVLGVAWLAATRLSASDEPSLGEDAARLESGANQDDDERIDAAVEAENSQPDDSGDPPPTTVQPSTTSSSQQPSTPLTTSLFADRDIVYGRYVAILWSDFLSTDAPAGTSVLEDELAKHGSRFGANVIAIDSSQFGSLRDGTVAVVYDGGFSSASEAKRWCRSNGFPGTEDCFGVVLSDDYTPNQRGEFIRVYDV